jgi:FkbM family methyltransferase
MVVEALRVPGPFVPGWFPLVVERLHRHVGPTRDDTSAVVLGSRMSLDTREHTQRRYFYHCYETAIAACLRRFVRPGDTVIDIGAYVGIFTLLAAKLVGVTGHVYSFEPVPETFARLIANVELNGYSWVTAQRAAVGETAGVVSLGIPEERFVGESQAQFTIGGTFESVDAPAVTLDEFFYDRPAVRLVKIDVEGTEPRVLAGASAFLTESPPDAILFEINQEMLDLHRSSAAEVFSLLSEAGYSLHRLDHLGHLRALRSSPRRYTTSRFRASATASSSKLVSGWATRSELYNAVALHRGS